MVIGPGTSWVVLRPVGTICVRDGRDQAMGGVLRSVLPSPSTIAGAVAAACTDPRPGAGLAAIAGPILHAEDDGLYLPLPADVVDTDDGWRVLPRPELTGDGDTVADMVIPASVLASYLGGDMEWVAGVRPLPVVAEPRIGLARQDRTAMDGMLYRAEHRRLESGWGLAARCEINVGHGLRERLVRLGGQGGHAWVQGLPTPDLPPPLDSFPGGRVAVYLATPALLEGGTAWCPPGAQLRGVACRGPQPIATSDRGGRAGAKLTWAVPAGSVFYLTFDTDQEAATWARTQHRQCLPQHQPLASTAGFGLALTGRWT